MNIIGSEVKMLWILDAGHGIETPGKRSPGKKTWDDGKTGIVEYEFNRDIVRRVSLALESMGIDTHVICQDEHTMSIADRKAIARTMIQEWDGDAAFISVHSNASGRGWNENARGVTVFTEMNPERKSKQLAEIMVREISVESSLANRGTRDCLWRNDKKVNVGNISKLPCPAVLTENGFMTSKFDCSILASEAGRIAIANGHVKAILRFQEMMQK